jgi:hypothetical protein
MRAYKATQERFITTSNGDWDDLIYTCMGGVQSRDKTPAGPRFAVLYSAVLYYMCTTSRRGVSSRHLAPQLVPHFLPHTAFRPVCIDTLNTLHLLQRI